MTQNDRYGRTFVGEGRKISDHVCIYFSWNTSNLIRRSVCLSMGSYFSLLHKHNCDSSGNPREIVLEIVVYWNISRGLTILKMFYKLCNRFCLSLRRVVQSGNNSLDTWVIDWRNESPSMHIRTPSMHIKTPSMYIKNAISMQHVLTNNEVSLCKRHFENISQAKYSSLLLWSYWMEKMVRPDNNLQRQSAHVRQGNTYGSVLKRMEAEKDIPDWLTTFISIGQRDTCGQKL